MSRKNNYTYYTPRGALVPKPCPVCGKMFKPRWRRSKYCSRDCQHRAIGKRELYCTKCRTKLTKKPSVYRNKNGWHFCSKECSNEYRTGERSPHWIKDRSKLKNEYRTIKMSKPFALWREAVFERDSYTCQICTARSGKGKAVELHPHHVKSFAEHPEERFNVNNGMTLCIDCHKWIHKAGNLLAGRIIP